jgi:hypothetical protein
MHPWELPQYFQDLDTHFINCKITNNKAKKTYAKRYLDIDAKEIWTCLPENDSTHTYDVFKKAILKLYPRANDEHHWSVANINNLITDHARQGIFNQQELGDYHHIFFAITEYLKGKGRISEMEANCNFVKGFRKELWDMIEQHLWQKNIDHFPDDPWSVSKVYYMMHFILHGVLPRIDSKTLTVKAEQLMALPILNTKDFCEGDLRQQEQTEG